jgi:methyl-accepting chemotaxis protein
MPDGTSVIVRLLSSLSFRLQFMTVFLSLVGLSFGIRNFLHLREQFGDERSLTAFHDLLLQAGIALFLNIIAAFIIYRIATSPIRMLSEVMRALTEGSLDINVPYIEQTTEIGNMARKVSIFKQNAIDKKDLEQQQHIQAIKASEEKKSMMEKLACDFEEAISSIVDIVASSAEDMKANAKNLSAMADQTNEQSSTVAAATAQTSASVQTVTLAAEQLSASIGEINHQVAESTRMSDEAVIEVRHADTTVSILSEAATQIGDVVKLIHDIASQTNLLALNATIEAARAGEAGKGFAVVASEVKNLASQTGRATEEIAKKIATVQSVSTETVSAIRSIGKTIEKNCEIAGAISTAIRQQTSATSKISKNVEQTAIDTGKISSSIVNVTLAATKSRAAANEVLNDSTKLSQQAERLRSEIHSFLNKVRQG